MNNFKPSLVFIYFHWMCMTSSLNITRGYTNGDGDTLACETNVNCNNIGAVNVNPTTCSCSGTFRITNKFRCVKDGGKASGCNFHFLYHKDFIQAIAVGADQIDNFLYSIETGTSCYKMHVESVQYLSSTMEWAYINTDFKITSSSRTNSYYLKWKNRSMVNVAQYYGQLLKISITCERLGAESIKNCVLGKILGRKSWKIGNIAKNICDGGSAPIVTTIPPTQSTTASTTTTSTSRVKTTNNTSIKTTTDMSKHQAQRKSNDTNYVLIGGVVGGIVVVAIILVVIARKKRQAKKQKKREHVHLYEVPSNQNNNQNDGNFKDGKHKDGRDHDNEDNYTTPYEVGDEIYNEINFANPAYLTKLDHSVNAKRTAYENSSLDSTNRNKSRVKNTIPSVEKRRTLNDNKDKTERGRKDTNAYSSLQEYRPDIYAAPKQQYELLRDSQSPPEYAVLSSFKDAEDYIDAI